MWLMYAETHGNAPRRTILVVNEGGKVVYSGPTVPGAILWLEANDQTRIGIETDAGVEVFLIERRTEDVWISEAPTLRRDQSDPRPGGGRANGLDLELPHGIRIGNRRSRREAQAWYRRKKRRRQAAAR